jgi:hypothetical protein
MTQTGRAYVGIAFCSLAIACGSSSPAAEHSAADSGAEAATPQDAGAQDAAAPGEGGSVGGFEAGAPIGALMDQTWTPVKFPEAHCRDGTVAGISINANSTSKKLVIFLEGGGACFNATTCATNPSSATFGQPSAGILSRTDMANPVKDWNFVDIPYCTGDVFFGNNPNGSVSGVSGTQQFVGYVDMALFLQRIVPTFPGVTQVLLTGVSAGGFGAAANYVQVARAFAPVPVTLLDDSGPSMRDPYLARCLQQQQVALWGIENTLLAECGSDCPDHSNYPIDAAKHAAKLFPNGLFGLIEATDDMVITAFFGFGLNNCTGSFSTPVSKDQFTAGLLDERTQLASYPNVGSFLFDGTRHTSLSTPSAFDTQTATGADGGTVPLTDWITDLVDKGKVSNVGPP